MIESDGSSVDWPSKTEENSIKYVLTSKPNTVLYLVIQIAGSAMWSYAGTDN